MFHSGKPTHPAHIGATIAFIVLVVSSYLFINTIKPTFAETSPLPLCPAGFTLIVGSTSQTGTAIPLTGMTNVMFSANATNASNVSRVMVLANEQQVGRAMAASAYSWNMPWVTQLSANGSYKVQAEVTMTNGGQCRTAPIQVAVQNSLPANLVLVTQPQSWQGPLSFSFPVTSNLRVPELNFDATQYAIFNYVITIGSISPNGATAQFTSGSTAGSGEIKVTATYGGRNIPVKIPVVVGNATAPLPAPTTTANSTGTTSTTTQSAADSTSTTTANTGSTSTITTQQATVAARTAVLSNNITAQDCVVAAIGKPRFDAINSGTARPTPEELKKFNACFASSNFILPSNFAPVAPTSLPDLAADTNVTITKLANEKITSGGSAKDALKISGKARPSSTVILYVFSEPLVLTTTADAEGNWTYELQDPIEAGKHEVYAVVDRGDGVYQKSSPFDFLIGTAQAASGNPDALSLSLAGDATPAQSNRSMLLYIVGAAVIVLLVVIIAIIILIKVYKKPPTTPTPPEQPMDNIASNSSNISPVAPITPTAPIDNNLVQHKDENENPATSDIAAGSIIQPAPTQDTAVITPTQNT